MLRTALLPRSAPGNTGRPLSGWVGLAKSLQQAPLPAPLTEAQCRDVFGWGGGTQPCLLRDDALLSKETPSIFQSSCTPCFWEKQGLFHLVQQRA